MSIMNCRTEKDTVLICEVPEKMYGIYVPRMIVQPIIGNAFFTALLRGRKVVKFA